MSHISLISLFLLLSMNSTNPKISRNFHFSNSITSSPYIYNSITLYSISLPNSFYPPLYTLNSITIHGNPHIPCYIILLRLLNYITSRSHLLMISSSIVLSRDPFLIIRRISCIPYSIYCITSGVSLCGLSTLCIEMCRITRRIYPSVSHCHQMPSYSPPNDKISHSLIPHAIHPSNLESTYSSLYMYDL